MNPDPFKGMSYCTKCLCWFSTPGQCNCWVQVQPSFPVYPTTTAPIPVFPYRTIWIYPYWTSYGVAYSSGTNSTTTVSL